MKPQLVATFTVVLTIVSLASGQFAPTCPADAKVVRATQANINAILKAHNDYRDKLAGGQVLNFPTASDMSVLSWDKDLAERACVNVMQCQMKHDSAATAKYPAAGQNLFVSSTTGNREDIEKFFVAAVGNWAGEDKFATPDSITTCCGGGIPGKAIGHFTQVARSNAIAVGCCASTYAKSLPWKDTLVACNYSYGNMVGTPVYKAGPVGAACKNGKDAVYKNLCK